jgi:alkanesulfonate monooxygenase SsuD/methylene tetrahydromethanopterin reductase-like flavin-dependent oxidoreductase (luciferase family)
MTPWVPVSRSAQVFGEYRRMADERNLTVADDFEDMSASICAIFCANTDEEAKEKAWPHVEFHFEKALGCFDSNTVSLIPGHMSPVGLKSWLEASSGKGGRSLFFAYEEAVEQGIFICGSPKTCIEQIRRQREEGKRGTLLSMFQFGSMPHEMAMENIRMFGEEVLPAVEEI